MLKEPDFQVPFLCATFVSKYNKNYQNKSVAYIFII